MFSSVILASLFLKCSLQNDLNPRVVVSFFPSSGNLFHKEGARNENLSFPALVLALGRNRLLFSTALVEWWCVGFSTRVLRHGGLILWKQLKVCRRMRWRMVSTIGMI